MDKLLLLQAFDSLFPIGAFTLSNGLETYVREGLVASRESLEEYLDAYLYLLPYNDLGAAAIAAKSPDITELDELLQAYKSPKELREGSRKLCVRFLKLQSALGEYPRLEEYRRRIDSGELYGHYAITVGLFIHDVGAEPSSALGMYCYSMLSAAVNHTVKLVPLRQNDGQAALRRAMAGIERAVAIAQRVTLSELGVSGGGFDLRSMRHESLESRMYIS